MKLTITIDLPDSTIPDTSAELDALNAELAALFSVDPAAIADGMRLSPIERLMGIIQSAPAALANREQGQQRQRLIEAYIQSESRAHAVHLLGIQANRVREQIRRVLADFDRRVVQFTPSSVQTLHRQNLAPHVSASTLDSISDQVREQVHTAIEAALDQARG